jgi:uncharacterized protein (TIGR00725 family)
MRTVIGIMGSGRDPGPEVLSHARTLGRLIAERGWVLLNGGRAAGVMEASAAGAREAGGFVIGVLPDEEDDHASEHLDVAIRTGMGEARNVINVLSSDVIIALPGGAGTLSEIAHAMRFERTVILLGVDPGAMLAEYRDRLLLRASSPEEAIGLAERALGIDDRPKGGPKPPTTAWPWA